MSTFSHPHGWLLLLYTLPAKKTSSRVNVWRKLKKIGACSLKTSGHVLPDEPVHLERFQWIAQQVKEDGGDVTLARVSSIDGLENDALVSLFNEARSEDYGALAKPLNDLIKANRRKLQEGFLETLEKLRQQFNEVRAIDYFACPAGVDVELLLQRASRLGAPRRKGEPRLDVENYRGCQWLTRPQPGIDRIGSAWLIKNFIDPEATFVFGNSPSTHPDALPYDMVDVAFTHHGDDCTFETLLKRFDITDPIARKIGEMIHDADLEDGKFRRHECFGLDLIFRGFARLGFSDAEILDQGLPCFEALSAALRK